MEKVNITKKDIDYIARVVETEVGSFYASRNPEEYSKMVKGVVDTITNRVASPSYPNTVVGVLDQYAQFSKINGPAKEKPYGSVEKTPKAPEEVESFVAGYLADRAFGLPSIIGANTHYANPEESDLVNQTGWVGEMIADGTTRFGDPVFGHEHGTARGTRQPGVYSLDVEGARFTGPTGLLSDEYTGVPGSNLGTLDGTAAPQNETQSMVPGGIVADPNGPQGFGLLGGIDMGLVNDPSAQTYSQQGLDENGFISAPSTPTLTSQAGFQQAAPQQQEQAPQDSYNPLSSPVTNPHSNFNEQGIFTANAAPSIASALAEAAPMASGILSPGYSPPASTMDALGSIADSSIFSGSVPSIDYSSMTTNEAVPSTVTPQAPETQTFNNEEGIQERTVPNPVAPQENTVPDDSRQRSGINPGGILGSIVGGLTMGPVGAIAGGILGSRARDSGILSGLSESISNGGLSGPFSGMQAPGQWMGGNFAFNPDFSTNANSAIDPNTGWTSHTNKDGVTTITGGMKAFPEDAQPMVSNAGIGGGPGAGKGG